MGNCPRTARRLLGYRDRQEQRASSLYCRRLEVQLYLYLVHIFQDHNFSQSRPTTCHSLVVSILHGLTAPSSALFALFVSYPCPNANGRIGPLAIRLPDWLTLRLPQMNQTWKGELTEVYVVKGY